MIEQIYLSFILIGATIAAVLAYLWQNAQRTNNIGLGLIRLNEQLNFDTPDFLRAAWPLLFQAGMLGMSWRLDWFGVPVEGQTGQMRGAVLEREIQVGEMRLAMTLYAPASRGERRYFNDALLETFLLLLRTDMWIKAGAAESTFSQMAKLSLFLQHDMKNLAQFIQLMADQIAQVPAGRERQVLDYLRTAVPLVRRNADSIVRSLTMSKVRSAASRPIQLREELAALCRLHRLDCTISGSAEIRATGNALDSALNNILKNYSDLGQRDKQVNPVIKIEIMEKNDHVDIAIEASNVLFAAHVERLFEPFWSSDPNGLGIGLYQAKQMLETVGGTLHVHQAETGQLQFGIRVPRHAGLSPPSPPCT